MPQKHYSFSHRLPLGLLFALFSLFLYSACTTTKSDNVLDRAATPEVRSDVPTGVSEIRELKYHKLGSEAGHETLHLRGQLFTKSSEGGTTQIRPCGGCTLLLNTPSDTSTHVRLVTETDGFFSYNGSNLSYNISLQNPGHNPINLGTISFEKEGITTLRIINAAGSTPERFSIVKTGPLYTWSKVQ